MNTELQIIFLSLQIALLATISIFPIGVWLGWLLARKQFFGKSFVDALINVPLVLPPVVTGYFLLILFGPNGYIGYYLTNVFGFTLAFHWTGAILAAGIVSLPLLVRSVRVAIENVDTKLEDAGRMLRANEQQVFFQITLPLL